MQKGKIKYGNNIVGQKFAMLTVLEFAGICGTGTHAKRMFRCLCDCGIEKSMRIAPIVSGRTISCGCITKPYQNEIIAKYGVYRLALLHRYRQMISRCHNPKDLAYKDYGARGIVVCDLWKENFLVYYDWAIANGLTDDLQVDRRNNDGEYSPENCRVATRLNNMRNTRKNRFITYNGETKCASEWAEIYGINEATIRGRIDNNWPPEKWFIPLTRRKSSDMPPKLPKPIIIQYDLSGNKIAQYKSISEAGRASGVPNSNISMFFSGLIKQTKGFTWAKMLPQTG